MNPLSGNNGLNYGDIQTILKEQEDERNNWQAAKVNFKKFVGVVTVLPLLFLAVFDTPGSSPQFRDSIDRLLSTPVSYVRKSLNGDPTDLEKALRVADKTSRLRLMYQMNLDQLLSTKNILGDHEFRALVASADSDQRPIQIWKEMDAIFHQQDRTVALVKFQAWQKEGLMGDSQFVEAVWDQIEKIQDLGLRLLVARDFNSVVHPSVSVVAEEPPQLIVTDQYGLERKVALTPDLLQGSSFLQTMLDIREEDDTMAVESAVVFAKTVDVIQGKNVDLSDRALVSDIVECMFKYFDKTGDQILHHVFAQTEDYLQREEYIKKAYGNKGQIKP